VIVTDRRTRKPAR